MPLLNSTAVASYAKLGVTVILYNGGNESGRIP